MRRKIAFLFIGFLCAISLAIAEEHQHGDHHAKEDLGTVHFAVSCTPDAQARFDHAAALLHSFWYAESEKAFHTVAETDPQCAMAYWGVAMSNYHPIWAPPVPAEMERGSAAAQKAASMDPKSDREKGFILAISTFYKDADKLDHRTRAQAYAQAMEKVHQANPDDLEASIFYALALLGTAQASDKSYAVQKQAADILTPLVAKAPNHPGIAHYIIHSFDYPSLAQLALPAARAYAKIAPASPHALHMPSHIFTRLGLWQESIVSNRASADAAKNHVQKTIPGAGSFDELHAMDYLTYAYLQLGEEDQAKAVVEEAAGIQKLDQNSFAAAYALAAIPARFAVERHQWKEAAALQVKPEWFPWSQFPYAEAITHFAAGLGAARTGDLESAKRELDKLTSIHQALEQEQYWAGQVEIQRQAVAAWIEFAEGKKEAALNQMKSATALEDSTEKHAVSPGAIMPAHELLGEMLMQMNQPAEALRQFEKSLEMAPNRLNAKKAVEAASKKAAK